MFRGTWAFAPVGPKAWEDEISQLSQTITLPCHIVRFRDSSNPNDKLLTESTYDEWQKEHPDWLSKADIDATTYQIS